MTTVLEICSYCHKSRSNCRCENYHPPIMLPDDIFALSKDEVVSLLKFIDDNGYISHEFHAPIISLTRKLREFVL